MNQEAINKAFQRLGIVNGNGIPEESSSVVDFLLEHKIKVCSICMRPQPRQELKTPCLDEMCKGLVMETTAADALVRVVYERTLVEPIRIRNLPA